MRNRFLCSVLTQYSFLYAGRSLQWDLKLWGSIGQRQAEMGAVESVKV
jgi:hypothetical protein